MPYPYRSPDTSVPGGFGGDYRSQPQYQGPAGAGGFQSGTPMPGSFGAAPAAQDPATFGYNPADPSSAVGYFFDPQQNPYQMSPQQNWALGGVVNQNLNGMPPDPLSNAGFGGLDRSMSASWDILNQGGPAPVSVAPTTYDPIRTDRSVTYDPYGWNDASLAQSVSAPGAPGAASAALGYGPASYAAGPRVNTARIDPDRAIQAAQLQMNRITSPAVRAAMQSAGMGRSGAEAEALANAGVALELPIAQTVLGADRGANELDAQIQANQQMQAQGLTASSYDRAMSADAGLQAGNADRQARMAELGYTGALNASMFNAGQFNDMSRFNATGAQNNLLSNRQFDMNAQQFNANLGNNVDQFNAGMGQDMQRFNAGLSQGNQQFNNSFDANRRGQDIGMTGDMNRINSGLAMGIPGLQTNQFNTGQNAWQNILGATNQPYQNNVAGYNNYQNFLLSLMGASPVPGGQTTTTNAVNTQSPNWLGMAGTLASAAGAFGSNW